MYVKRLKPGPCNSIQRFDAIRLASSNESVVISIVMLNSLAESF